MGWQSFLALPYCAPKEQVQNLVIPT